MPISSTTSSSPSGCSGVSKIRLRKHPLLGEAEGYKEEPDTFRKIGNYLNRPEYKFLSKHTNAGALYWVMPRV